MVCGVIVIIVNAYQICLVIITKRVALPITSIIYIVTFVNIIMV